jgi:hypothetical protein
VSSRADLDHCYHHKMQPLIASTSNQMYLYSRV